MFGPSSIKHHDLAKRTVLPTPTLQVDPGDFTTIPLPKAHAISPARNSLARSISGTVSIGGISGSVTYYPFNPRRGYGVMYYHDPMIFREARGRIFEEAGLSPEDAKQAALRTYMITNFGNIQLLDGVTVRGPVICIPTLPRNASAAEKRMWAKCVRHERSHAKDRTGEFLARVDAEKFEIRVNGGAGKIDPHTIMREVQAVHGKEDSPVWYNKALKEYIEYLREHHKIAHAVRTCVSAMHRAWQSLKS